MSGPFKDWPVISVYTREQAIADGVLVDVTAEANETGFAIPVCITAAVHAACTPPPSNRIESWRGRLHDVLYLAYIRVRAAIRAGRSGPSRYAFKVRIGRTIEELFIDFSPVEGFTIGYGEDF